MQLLNSDWSANILAGLNFQAKENGLMSPDGVCAISAGPAGHETNFRLECFPKPSIHLKNEDLFFSNVRNSFAVNCV